MNYMQILPWSFVLCISTDKSLTNWISQRSFIIIWHVYRTLLSSWGEVVQVNTQALIKTVKETKHTKQPSYILVWEDPLGWVKQHFKNASESSLILSLVARKEVCKSNAQGTGILYAIYSVLKGSVSRNNWTVLQPRYEEHMTENRKYADYLWYDKLEKYKAIAVGDSSITWRYNSLITMIKCTV